MVAEKITFENAQLMFKNFAGKEGKFNREGDRSFSVRIGDTDVANALIRDGWNVRQLRPREDDEEGTYILPVAVRYDNFPPHIWLVTSRGKELLTEETVGLLDCADITNVDLIVTPYSWSLANGQSGVKAYVKTMYVTIDEDEFAHKYE